MTAATRVKATSFDRDVVANEQTASKQKSVEDEGDKASDNVDEKDRQ